MFLNLKKVGCTLGFFLNYTDKLFKEGLNFSLFIDVSVQMHLNNGNHKEIGKYHIKNLMKSRQML